MCRTIFILLVISGFSLRGYAEDEQAVRDLLDECGMEGVTVADVAVMENGQVVKLDISNPDIAQDGITMLPAAVGRLTGMKELICRNNSISELPPEIGDCVSLETLDCASNRIVAVPPEIGNLRNLKRLDLRHNSLSVIPPELGNCTQLEYLWLWGNKLTALDPAITRLRKLKELYLKDNRLTTLPVGIVGMRFTYIDLLGNRLCNLSTLLDRWAKKIDEEYKSTQKCR